MRFEPSSTMRGSRRLICDLGEKPSKQKEQKVLLASTWRQFLRQVLMSEK